MHEISIAHNIIKTVENSLKNQNVTKVTAIRVDLGVLSGVSKDALLFSYDIATKNTLLQNSKLQIDEQPLTIWCQDCKRETVINDAFILKCAHCGKHAPDILKGKELQIRNVEVIYETKNNRNTKRNSRKKRSASS